MGLCTFPVGYEGSYTGFQMLRTEIARALGYETDQTNPLRSSYHLRPEQYRYINDLTLMGEWDSVPEDPALVLMIHEDCDGMIPHEIAGQLADRIESAIPNLRENEPTHSEVRYRDMARTFVSGLRLCAEGEFAMEFG